MAELLVAVMALNPSFASGNVLGVRVAAVTREEAAGVIRDAISNGTSGYVCAAPVHSIMEAHDDPDFRVVLNSALMVVPDGFPVAWALRSQVNPKQQRVAGPDLMLELCRGARFQLKVTFNLHGYNIDFRR